MCVLNIRLLQGAVKGFCVCVCVCVCVLVVVFQLTDCLKSTAAVNAHRILYNSCTDSPLRLHNEQLRWCEVCNIDRKENKAFRCLLTRY